MSGTLFVVATPIGNLEDITIRALRVLREVSVIAAEDTRHTAKLLARHAITTSTTSLHEHNEASKSPSLIARLERGENVALVSDAGTPTISDPGGRLIREAVEQRVAVQYFADERDSALQRASLAEEIASVCPGFAEVDYRDWDALLARFWREAPAGCILVLDEFPQLVAVTPELPSVLQRHLEPKHGRVGPWVVVGREPRVTEDHRDVRRVTLVEEVVGGIAGVVVTPAPGRAGPACRCGPERVAW